ncbi:MAG: hypothetical protein RLZZ262_841 [Bacteroidota bacterium]|jgi:GNAT superfamily N-acetyltransferase
MPLHSINVREAFRADIPQMQKIRNAVKENTLSDPSLISDKDYEEFLDARGKSWVCEHDGRLVGFASVDLIEHNVWALFVDPSSEKLGIGRQLHETMLQWYFSHTTTPIWLGTEPRTRAAQFYRKAGWREIGLHGTNEVKFEMNYQDWLTRNPIPSNL